MLADFNETVCFDDGVKLTYTIFHLMIHKLTRTTQNTRPTGADAVLTGANAH